MKNEGYGNMVKTKRLKILLGILLAVISLKLVAIPYESKPFIDPEVRPIVKRFVEEGNYRGLFIRTDHLVVIFGSTETVSLGAIGVCYSMIDGSRYIILDRDFWNSFRDEATRELLLFHELGHCALNRFEHIDHNREDGLPASIMNSSLIETKDYVNNRDYYLDELFSREKR